MKSFAALIALFALVAAEPEAQFSPFLPHHGVTPYYGNFPWAHQYAGYHHGLYNYNYQPFVVPQVQAKVTEETEQEEAKVVPQQFYYHPTNYFNYHPYGRLFKREAEEEKPEQKLIHPFSYTPYAAPWGLNYFNNYQPYYNHYTAPVHHPALYNYHHQYPVHHPVYRYAAPQVYTKPVEPIVYKTAEHETPASTQKLVYNLPVHTIQKRQAETTEAVKVVPTTAPYFYNQYNPYHYTPLTHQYQYAAPYTTPYATPFHYGARFNPYFNRFAYRF